MVRVVRPRQLLKFRRGHSGVLAWALSFSAAATQAQTPVTVQGRVVSGAPASSPLPGALVDVLQGDSVLTSVRTPDGHFSVTLPASARGGGPLLLRARAIGFAKRLDTLHVPANGELRDYQIALTAVPFCVHGCAPDSAVVAAAWARRASWSCARGAEEEEHAEAEAVLQVVSSPHLRRDGRIRHPASEDAGRLQPERRDAVCRRLGQSVVRRRREGTAATTFRVYRLGEVWLLQATGEDVGYILGPDQKVRAAWCFCP